MNWYKENKEQWKEVIETLLNYRKRLPTMHIQRIQDYALSAPNSNKVFERLQMEVL